MLRSTMKTLCLGMILAALLGTTAAAVEKASLTPAVLLPDGEEFKTWEQPATFSRTYYVDQAHPRASDDNPGTQDQPLRTIDRAAQLLEPGQRAVIAEGVYRERVRPARGGNGPGQMISYEAAPGAEVIVSASQLVPSKWSPSDRDKAGNSAGVWMITLPQEMFSEENPFQELNLTDAQIDRSMPWAVPTKGKSPNTLRRGLLFQDGKRLAQVGTFDELRRSEGTYWVGDDGRTVHARPIGGGDPNQARFEATVRGSVFAPETYGLGYLRVKGLTIQHAGNCFPRPQQGALSTRRGHHWIIEDCTVRQCNSIGIDIGDQFDVEGPELAEGGEHIVRRNRIADCGIGGIEGKQIEHTWIEDNVIRRCGWHDCWRIYECGGIKVHCTRSCLLRRNLVTNTVGCPGIWMDYANVNSRCTGNVVMNCQCETGGIFMEASQAPNLVDTNLVLFTRGNGIYQHDCDELVIAQNLVVASTDAAVRMRICQGRKVQGRLTTARRNKILNNLFVDHARPLAISDPDNVSDFNIFVNRDAPFDLGKWQEAHDWDRHSRTAALQVQFDPATLELTWTAEGELPRVPRVDRITHDFWRTPRTGEATAPGPFADVPADRTRWRLDEKTLLGF